MLNCEAPLPPSARNQPSTNGLEEKVRVLKEKLLHEKEGSRKLQEDMAVKARKAQEVAREEATQRKELNEKFITEVVYVPVNIAFLATRSS